MKRAILALTAVVFLSLLSAPKATAGGPFDITNNYYTDAWFTTSVGWEETFCDDTYDYDGTFTAYRYQERTNCSNHNVMANCQAWNSTTNTWDNITCADESATVMGRLRIPVG